MKNLCLHGLLGSVHREHGPGEESPRTETEPRHFQLWWVEGRAQPHRVRNGSVSTDIYWLLSSRFSQALDHTPHRENHSTPSRKDVWYRNPAVQGESGASPPWKLIKEDPEELNHPLLPQHCTHPWTRAPFSSSFSGRSVPLLWFCYSTPRQEGSGLVVSDCTQHSEPSVHIPSFLWFPLRHWEMPKEHWFAPICDVPALH